MVMLSKAARVFATLAGCAILAAGLSGCESARQAFSNQKSAPDEFAIYQRPPLSVPSSFTLPPPDPSRDNPQVITPMMQAQAALIGEKTMTVEKQDLATTKESTGTKVFLAETGAPKAAPNIREIVNKETAVLSKEDQRFIDKLIFWVDAKPYPGVVVDASKEKKRIQENQALGKPITDGATPKIVLKRGHKGLLEF